MFQRVESIFTNLCCWSRNEETTLLPRLSRPRAVGVVAGATGSGEVHKVTDEATLKFSPTYIRYINSEAWRKRRARALKLAGHRCQVCGRNWSLQVHHNTYERLGHEADSDLLVTCASCHWGITWMLRVRRWWRRVYTQLFKQ